MPEINHFINTTPVRMISHRIPYEHGPVIHVDICEGEHVIAAARLMPPYHRSMLEIANKKTESGIEWEVLTLFSSGSLPLTPGRVLELRRIMEANGFHKITPMYQHPADVAV
ncbi:hypothetical protein ACO0LM_24515 [Undibacterium sp. Di26W]|uniref:hypothetical protein n=1 Tax=Undibacterium sp. Di26W TaxID=3413035 RepID=UPI003BF0E6BB